MRLRFLFILLFITLNSASYSTNIKLDGVNVKLNEKDTDHFFNLDNNWHFAIGDNKEWANSNFNYSKWDTLNLPFCIEDLKSYKFAGNIWLRSTFSIKPEMVSKPISLNIKQFGASEIYIDGKLMHQFGKVGNSLVNEESYNPYHTPISFTLDSAGTHQIAIRYSNHNMFNTYEAEIDAFDLTIINAEKGEMIDTVTTLSKQGNSIGIGIFLTLSIINFILFLFYKRDKANLYYSIFSIVIAITFILNVIGYTCDSVSSEFLLQKINIACLFISNFFLIALVYSFIYEKNPKRFKVILAVAIFGNFLTFINFDFANSLSNIFNVYCAIDIIIVVVKAISKRYNLTKKHRRIFWLTILSIVVVACLGYFINTSIPFIVLGLLALIFIVPIAGMIFIIPLYMTIRHAKNFSVTNQNLEQQLIHVKELSEQAILQEQEKKKMLESENERLEKMVTERTAELAEKNHEIKDSINYALRIQKAILTSKEEVNEGLKNCFILFKPKDIVSGDFYFYSKQEDKVLIAAADCTGHGVPGALMSMIGSEKLMSTVKENTNPATILNLLNKGIKSSLRQTEHEESTKDGMDIALVSINLETLQVSYAGANRPIWIIRNGSKTLEEIKATKKAIGGFTEDNQEFAQHELQFNTGDTFYLFTDGYADQFGHSGKKLMTKKFREILIEIQSTPMHEQETYLNNFIETWKKDTEQVDDILVIGVRI